MVQGIDLEQVKQYNSSLRVYKDKASNLRAQIEYAEQELKTLCDELSKELGFEVTKDNLEEVYNQQVEKINSTLQSGKAVLNKIAEGSKAEEQTQAQIPVPQQTIVQPQELVQTTVEQPFVQPPVQGSVFTGQTITGQLNQGPLFSI